MTEPARWQGSVRRLLAAGALLHLLFTTLIYVVGRSGLLPRMIYANGAMPVDGAIYLEKCVALGQNISRFAVNDTPVHVRLYALSSAILTPILGANILSVELTGLLLYVLMLFLIYKVGEICFDARTGIVAAAIVGLLPSLLLHSTQPLHDPLFIVLMLLNLWLTIALITKPVNFARAAIYTAGGFLTLLLLWLTRDAMWPVYLAIVALALAVLCIVSLKDRRILFPNFACLLFLAVALVLIPKIFAGWLPPKEPVTSAQEQAIEEFRNQQINAGQSGVFLKLSTMRQKFVVLYPDAGSNIDTGQTFRKTSDVLFYLPRAAAIGLFAPFPAQWLTEGKMFGRLGRIVSGVEMCFFYLLSLCALAGIWRSRRSMQTWFLLAVVLLGAAALGLVVVNLGALYRMRYVFWILLVIPGAHFLQKYLTPKLFAHPLYNRERKGV
ncbi:MAG: hypothetical protein ABR577_08010 [Pyrinomonadaceae bacterium]